ncbi:N-terminal acetyltransferase [Ascosphaera aggregata]|nr:N-terminal acetyltransferase [Ascosphaera aggregata]
MTDPSSPAYRPTLTDEQLCAYLSRVNFGAAAKASTLSSSSSSSSSSSDLSALRSQVSSSPLATLRALQTAHLRSITFDNLGVHYNPDHRISLQADDIIDKIVVRRKGGYCMENTGLFSMVLRSLGYELYTGGARVNRFFGEKEREKWENGFWTGWDHMVLFVTIDEKTYLVDVGFGPKGPTCPIPLEEFTPHQSAISFDHRLVKVPLKANTSRRAPVPWTLQYRDIESDGEEWHTTYTFYEVEFLPSDYEVMNWHTSTAPGEMFVEMLIVARWDWDEAEGKFGGWTFLKNGKVVKRVRGKVEDVDVFGTEAQRVEGIRRWFGIELTEEEAKAIKGLRTELLKQ